MTTDSALLIEASVTQSILALLYALTIARMYYLKSTMNFVLLCCLFLITAAVCWIVVEALGYDMVVNDYSPICGSNLNPDGAKVCRTQIFFIYVNNVTFASAIWLFSMRFWSVQYTIKLQV